MSKGVVIPNQLIGEDETPTEAARGDMVIVEGRLNGKTITGKVAFICEREDFDLIRLRAYFTIIQSASAFMAINGDFDIGSMEVLETTLRDAYGEDNFRAMATVREFVFPVQHWLDDVLGMTNDDVPLAFKTVLNSDDALEKAGAVMALFSFLIESHMTMSADEMLEIEQRVNRALGEKGGES